MGFLRSNSKCKRNMVAFFGVDAKQKGSSTTVRARVKSFPYSFSERVNTDLCDLD